MLATGRVAVADALGAADATALADGATNGAAVVAVAATEGDAVAVGGADAGALAGGAAEGAAEADAAGAEAAAAVVAVGSPPSDWPILAVGCPPHAANNTIRARATRDRE